MTWKGLLFILSIVVLVAWGCTKNPCTGVVCKNGGACIDGNCICPMGYNGTDCGQQIRNQFIGDFVGDGIDQHKNAYHSWHAIFQAKGDSAMKMQVLVTDSAKTIQLPFVLRIQADLKSFLLDSMHSGNYIYQGSGYLGSTISSLSLQRIDKSIPDTVNYAFDELIKQ
jgi:hypothetical protein